MSGCNSFTIIEKAINEKTSYDFKLSEFIQIDESVLPISNVKVYVFLKPESGDDEIVYINNRDGTNNTGLTLQDNIVSFHMSPVDNAIVSSNTGFGQYEKHIVRLEMQYNSGSDTFYIGYEMLVKNLTIVE